MFHFFKTGEAVPQWLQKTNVILTFQVDVMVHKLEKVAHIFPFVDSNNDKSIMKMTVPGGFVEHVQIDGYPTVTHPYGISGMFSDYEDEKHTFRTQYFDKRDGRFKSNDE